MKNNALSYVVRSTNTYVFDFIDCEQFKVTQYNDPYRFKVANLDGKKLIHLVGPNKKSKDVSAYCE
ncbi:MAG: hypothetical protein AB8U25_06175 [Rickettsiales endosymbiont of Dermacentor nuttalli]